MSSLAQLIAIAQFLKNNETGTTLFGAPLALNDACQSRIVNCNSVVNYLGIVVSQKSDVRSFAFASRLSKDDENEQNIMSLGESKPTAHRVTKRIATARNQKTLRKLTINPELNSSGLDLFEVIDPQHQPSDIVLDANNFRLLAEITQEIRKRDDLKSFGLHPRSKLLFCGPPGCGKTLCAEVLAYELKLPLVVARLDGLITTYLGETASNIRKVFDAASRSPCVLFLDEFDALARTRADLSEHNEIRRVVNSLLKMIDCFTGRGLLIAATNLHSSIDHAAWRRFDEVLLFERPNVAQIRRLLKVKTRNFGAAFDIQKYADELLGMSYAEIERACVSAIKREIISSKKTISPASFEAAIKDEKRRISIRNNNEFAD